MKNADTKPGDSSDYKSINKESGPTEETKFEFPAEDTL